jgi:hypothetical protein
MSFDYGVSENRMGVSNHPISFWKTEGEMTALVDADMIPYMVGYTSTFEEYLRFQNNVKPFESEIWKDKLSQVCFLLDSWVSSAGCDSAILYLTDSANNFRLDIGTVKEYKGQRKEEKPPFFSEIKTWLHEVYGSVMSVRCEADDCISMEAWKRHKKFFDENGVVFDDSHKHFIDFVIVSKDKDLKIIPGLHQPPGEDKRIWVTPTGSLDPVYKESEVDNYEDWPVFSGSPQDPKWLFVMRNTPTGISPSPYIDMQIGKKGDDWIKDFIWCNIDSNLRVYEQDKFLKGKNKGSGKFKRVKTGKVPSFSLKKLAGTGLKFFYAQLIMGDSVDNYPGIPGAGQKKALEILEGKDTELEMFHAVLSEYTSYYRHTDVAIERLIEQARLAHMQTYEGELWTIPTDVSGTFPDWGGVW